MEDIRHAYTISVGKPVRKGLLGEPRRQEDNIKHEVGSLRMPAG
jgi:hypothetical protein